jgi:hypothetical protein
MVKFIGVIGITLMVVQYAEPIQWIKKHYGLTLDVNNDKKIYKKLLQKLLNCAFCLGFWVGLAFYWDLYWAVVISFSAELTYLIWKKITSII